MSLSATGRSPCRMIPRPRERRTAVFRLDKVERRRPRVRSNDIDTFTIRQPVARPLVVHALNHVVAHHQIRVDCCRCSRKTSGK